MLLPVRHESHKSSEYACQAAHALEHNDQGFHSTTIHRFLTPVPRNLGDVLLERVVELVVAQPYFFEHLLDEGVCGEEA